MLLASIGIYGIILAGWSSNSKYPLLASLRASAQLISYEVAVTLTLVSVIMMAGIVVSNGILLVDYTNRLRGRGTAFSRDSRCVASQG